MVTVSVVVPFRNADSYLPEAIASVQTQTWTDWEMLLVDDGSTDRSADIVSEAAAVDPRLRALRRAPDAGGNAAAARNLGIREARGDFVAFLDADDVFEPDALESRLHGFESHPEVMVVYGPTRWWHPGAEHRDWVEEVRREAGRVHRPPELVNRVLLLQLGHVPCTCGLMVRRRALELTGGFEEAFHLYEDQTLWVKLMLRFPVYVTPRVAARYRQHAGSATARSEAAGVYVRTRPHVARVAFLQWIRDHAREAGLAQDSVERALRLAFAPYGDDEARLGPRDRLTLVGIRLRKRIHRSVERIIRRVRS
jgi:glycosyltransferase involved in cell wall biosynthesis